MLSLVALQAGFLPKINTVSLAAVPDRVRVT